LQIGLCADIDAQIGIIIGTNAASVIVTIDPYLGSLELVAWFDNESVINNDLHGTIGVKSYV